MTSLPLPTQDHLRAALISVDAAMALADMQDGYVVIICRQSGYEPVITTNVKNSERVIQFMKDGPV